VYQIVLAFASGWLNPRATFLGLLPSVVATGASVHAPFFRLSRLLALLRLLVRGRRSEFTKDVELLVCDISWPSSAGKSGALR
jgi:hypothetical protein